MPFFFFARRAAYKRRLPGSAYIIPKRPRGFLPKTAVFSNFFRFFLISSLFLTDTHAFHKFCAIILFVGGLLYFVCEILVPTTKEELEYFLEKLKIIVNNLKGLGDK